MDLDKPLDLSRERRNLDWSGTPAALIEQARRRGNLAVLDDIADADILVEYPMGPLWQEQTGCARFVQLRPGLRAEQYALVRKAADG
jgi:hypothetical protein